MAVLLGGVAEVLLVGGVGGALGVIDRVCEGGGECGVARLGDGCEGAVLRPISIRDHADEVGVDAVDVEFAHWLGH